jgi:hypothetical protein
MAVTYKDFPALRKNVDEILAIFKANPDKHAAHKAATPILEAMTHDPQVLADILELNFSQPGFFARTNYPVPNLGIDSNPYFDMHVNCWVPLPDKNTNMSTKALHHHGPMLLSTATAFGPGYEHWMLSFPERIDEHSDLYGMQLIDRSHHYRHHVAFVDKYIVHVPMYIPSLTMTYALWTNSKPTTWRDRLKRVKFFQRNQAKLRKLLTQMGLAKALDIKPLENLDFYPADGGFKQLRFRDQVEFKRGPTSDYLQSIFYVIQQTSGDRYADRIEQIVKAEPKLAAADREIALSLIAKLRSGEEIEPKMTAELHYGFEYANFTAEQIEHALATQAGARRLAESAAN